MTRIQELENLLLDQIEKLNQDDVLNKPDELQGLLDRSKAITELTDSLLDVQRLKIDTQRVKIEAVKVAKDQQGLGYDKYLGISADSNDTLRIGTTKN
mgnify:CR=1 FL=1